MVAVWESDEQEVVATYFQGRVEASRSPYSRTTSSSRLSSHRLFQLFLHTDLARRPQNPFPLPENVSKVDSDGLLEEVDDGRMDDGEGIASQSSSKHRDASKSKPKKERKQKSKSKSKEVEEVATEQMQLQRAMEVERELRREAAAAAEAQKHLSAQWEQAEGPTEVVVSRRKKKKSKEG